MEENSSTKSQNKLSGKTEFSGRRRTTRQRSGFTSHQDSTGGEYTNSYAEIFPISPTKPLLVRFTFPKNKTWKDYVRDKRLEVACGEAPYITSRYDTTTGEFIPVNERIGILDRKLRVINENVNTSGEWLKAVQSAFKSTYAYEWQGDSLLLAREAMLFTFIENYRLKFNTEPLLKSIKYIAYIISWNVWQMDGIKGVIPNSCREIDKVEINLFGENETTHVKCEGCEKDKITKHTGIYSLVKDWSNKDKETGKKGRRIRYIDLLKN